MGSCQKKGYSKITPSTSRLRWTTATVLLSVVICYIIYRPLPSGLTRKPLDRFYIHLFESALRVTYYWPSRLFPKATTMVWWTRFVLNALSPILGPWGPDRNLIVETQVWDGVTVRVFSPRGNASTNGAVFFIHGGGFALGNIDIYDSLTRRIAHMLNSVVVSVEYRLSPETPFPGGLHDCETALEHFIRIAQANYGVDPNKIVLMGDSAGGNLVAVITQRRRDTRAKPEILGQVLLYPLLQLADFQSISYRYFFKNLNGLALVDPESVAYYYMFYAGIDMDKHGDLVKYALVNGHIAPEFREKVDKILNYTSFSYLNYGHSGNDSLAEKEPVVYSEEAQRLLAPFIANPNFSPLMQEDLSRLPSAFVMTCEYDVLRDEGMLYAKRLKDAGVKTEARNYINGFHAMLNFHHEIDEAGASLQDIVAWTRDTIESI
uniref:Arylacetamide deacetylase n=1 Tax=Haemonchus contortus TaxID=6289 RepID=A0A7I4Z7G0_HAECO